MSEGIPKIFHLFWDNRKLTLMHVLTLISFLKFNPDWKIWVWRPNCVSDELTWTTDENKGEYDGYDYMPLINNIANVEIKCFDADQIMFEKNMSCVHISDYFRLWVMYNYGGIYGDFDILFLGKMEDKINMNDDCFIIICNHYIPVAFFGSISKHKLFLDLMENAPNRFKNTEYQCLGAHLWMDTLLKHFIEIRKLLKRLVKKKKFNHHSELIQEKISEYYKSKICVYNPELYLPIESDNIIKIFDNNLNLKTNEIITQKTVGLHWFNGSPMSRTYVNEFENRIQSLKNLENKSLIDKLIIENGFDQLLIDFINIKNKN